MTTSQYPYQILYSDSNEVNTYKTVNNSNLTEQKLPKKIMQYIGYTSINNHVLTYYNKYNMLLLIQRYTNSQYFNKQPNTLYIWDVVKNCFSSRVSELSLSRIMAHRLLIENNCIKYFTYSTADIKMMLDQHKYNKYFYLPLFIQNETQQHIYKYDMLLLFDINNKKIYSLPDLQHIILEVKKELYITDLQIQHIKQFLVQFIKALNINYDFQIIKKNQWSHKLLKTIFSSTFCYMILLSLNYYESVEEFLFVHNQLSKYDFNHLMNLYEFQLIMIDHNSYNPTNQCSPMTLPGLWRQQTENQILLPRLYSPRLKSRPTTLIDQHIRPTSGDDPSKYSLFPIHENLSQNNSVDLKNKTSSNKCILS